MNQEVEVKLRLSESPADARRRLESAGATLDSERCFEDNVLYDDGALTLARAGGLLRLRRTRGAGEAARLTWKEPAPGDQGRYKIRSEIETRIADPEALDTILRRLGFSAVYRYQKYRTNFRCQDLKISLDETPIGNFVELEGPRERIDAFAARLGSGPDDYINLSYRDLQEAAFAGTGREPGDMLFEASCGG